MRIALVSDAPIASLRRPLSARLALQKITPRYTIIEDAVGDFSEAATHLHTIQPQITVLVTEAERLVPELFRATTLTAPVALRRSVCDAAVELLCNRVAALRTGTGGTLLVADLPIPLNSPLGIQDTAVEMGLRASIARINRDVARRVRRLPRVRMLSFSNVVQRVGRQAVDLEMASLGASAWSAKVFEGLAEELNRHLHAMLGRTRTVLVMEADGVIWGGSAEERGATGIQVNPKDKSRKYLWVQEACLNLRKRGIQLALATRTSREDVIDALTQHPHMRLKPSHFAHMEMRWADKATLLRNIAEVLDVDEDRMVYVDANRSECSWVSSTLQDVEVLSFDTPAELVELLSTHVAFESDRLFLEAEPPLTHLEPWRASNDTGGLVEGIEGYLQSLETSVSVGIASRFELPQMFSALQDSEMVELTGRHLSQNVVEIIAQNPRCQVWWIRLEDRFEASSTVGLAVFHRGDEVWTLQHFLLSAHVMSRGVDSAVIATIADFAKEEGADRIAIHCLRSTEQQSAPGAFFETMGLERTGFSADGVSYGICLKEQEVRKLWRPSYVQCTAVLNEELKEIAA
jgi:FkbH-like protein